jgi:tetratricopeptide (TPR) repeat protein
MELERAGKYRIIERIGQGAMGEVFKAHDPLLNRYVAIKTISSALGADEEFQRRFRQEAQSAARLNHPNIVTVFDFGEEQGITYMAMELLEGTDLREAIRRRLLLTLDDKLAVMEQICDGLGFAHARGIVHRDLKPGNIHIQPSGHVKVLDFGLARLGQSEITRAGTVMGTPHYMSPEQVRGQRVDARSDVFSLGALLYELISNHRPFDADSMHSVLYRILETEPDPIRTWAPDVPARIVSVVECALAKDPDARFAHASEMGEEVRAAHRALEAERASGGLEPVESGGEPTMLLAQDRTVAQSVPPRTAAVTARRMVKGATALDLDRVPAPAALPSTERPGRTVAGGSATQHSRRRGAPRTVLIGGLVSALVVVSVGTLVYLRVLPGRPAPSPAVAGQQAGVLSEALLSSQLELARADLDNKDYASAARRAEEALKLDPGNADAQALRDLARSREQELDLAAASARDAFAKGELERASAELGRVLALDPRHPVAAELSANLNRQFRAQAEDARRRATESRAGAERLKAVSSEEFTAARKAQQDAEGLLRREEYAVATQRFLESRDGFERAARAAEAAQLQRGVATASRSAASPDPRATPLTSSGAAPGSSNTPTPSATPAAASTESAAAGVAAPPPAPPPQSPPAVPQLVQPPATSAPAASTRIVETGDQAVRKTIADYGRAIESQDVALFKTLKPDLSADEEKRLREAFKAIKSQQVGITIEAVQIDGAQATVRVKRQDTVNGKPQKPVSQVFRLTRGGGGWRIESIGQ